MYDRKSLFVNFFFSDKYFWYEIKEVNGSHWTSTFEFYISLITPMPIAAINITKEFLLLVTIYRKICCQRQVLSQREARNKWIKPITKHVISILVAVTEQESSWHRAISWSLSVHLMYFHFSWLRTSIKCLPSSVCTAIFLRSPSYKRRSIILDLIRVSILLLRPGDD